MIEEINNIEDELEREEKKSLRRRNIIFFLFFLILLFFSVFGITYSIYKGDGGGEHEIITGEIKFTYSDAEFRSRGISISDAMPMSDEVGKALNGSGQFFDFSITSTSKRANIHYQLLVRKSANSTLSDSNIRMYLVSLNNNVETPLLLSTYSNLKQVTLDGNDYYVLYEKTLDKGIENYSDFYRLRMWVKQDAKDFMQKTFSFKVTAHAVQVGD